jgi:hypothetical protein
MIQPSSNALALLLYTAQRRGDVVKMGRLENISVVLSTF